MTEPPSPLRMLLSRHTRRRAFIALVGGAAAVWPVAARAQQIELDTADHLTPIFFRQQPGVIKANQAVDNMFRYGPRLMSAPAP